MDELLILDRYRLVERLAAGGTAEVWRAHDEQLDRPVAVKRLHPHLLPDEASRHRLMVEARAAASLSHPVVVGVYDVDAGGDWPAIVMELVDGEPLSARIAREGPLEPREAAAIAADVADALYHAHQRGVIHRDVKPGNVLLSRDGRTRLVDFGIARSLADASSRLTLTGTVVGTLAAMAPEQLADGPITPRTDLYGLGVVLHEALTGRLPYETTSPLALAEAQRAGPRDLDGVDPALAALVAGCLAHDPSGRPLHAGAVADALRAWLAGDSAPATAMAPPPAAPVPSPVDTGAITQPMAAVPSPSGRDPSAPPGAPVVRRPNVRSDAPHRRPLAIMLGVAAVALVATVVLAGLGGMATATPPTTPVPTAEPSSSARPAWLAELAAAVGDACGADAAADAESRLAAMTEDEARAAADELIAACTDAAGGGNDKDKDKGKGNGGNNGRGNGG